VLPSTSSSSTSIVTVNAPDAPSTGTSALANWYLPCFNTADNTVPTACSAARVYTAEKLIFFVAAAINEGNNNTSTASVDSLVLVTSVAGALVLDKSPGLSLHCSATSKQQSLLASQFSSQKHATTVVPGWSMPVPQLPAHECEPSNALFTVDDVIVSGPEDAVEDAMDVVFFTFSVVVTVVAVVVPLITVIPSTSDRA